MTGQWNNFLCGEVRRERRREQGGREGETGGREKMNGDNDLLQQ
jgi:hypothetical protein